MNTHRKIAIIVGVLYIIGTVGGSLSVILTQSTLTDPDYLSKVVANENQTRNGYGGMADREEIQPICNGHPVYQRSREPRR